MNYSSISKQSYLFLASSSFGLSSPLVSLLISVILAFLYLLLIRYIFDDGRPWTETSCFIELPTFDSKWLQNELLLSFYPSMYVKVLFILVWVHVFIGNKMRYYLLFFFFLSPSIVFFFGTYFAFREVVLIFYLLKSKRNM